MAEPLTHFYTRYYASPVGKIAIMTMDDGHDYEKSNALSESALMSLSTALDELLLQADIKGLMLTGKPYIFAGADLTEVPFISTYDQGYQNGKLAHTVMKRIMDLPFPTLAAINGVALGGGLEIALYCKYRTIARSVEVLGFPECFLGLIPGWGGCTLGTKLLGLKKAFELIIYNPLDQNKLINGVQAFEIGLADRLFDGGEFLDDSLRFLVDIIANKVSIERQAAPKLNVDLKSFISAAKKFIDTKIHGTALAPYRALKLMEGACTWDVDRGFEEENIVLGDLMKSMQRTTAYSDLFSFDQVNSSAKKPKANKSEQEMMIPSPFRVTVFEKV
jgi:enoyl-CoA hydratase/carnithine racemase